MLADGSMHSIERETTVLLEIKFCNLDPQELQIMEEQAVRNVVEKIGESILWGAEQELSLLRYDDWKGEYVRIEDGDEMVEEIDRRKGWDSKHAQFCAELIELNGDSRVGYVLSKLAAQMAEDDWAAKRHTQPILTKVTVLTGEAIDNAVTVDWNIVDINDQTDLVIAPISDIEMAKLFDIPVDEEDKKKESDEADDDGNR
jgi:hypothetical protein